MKRRQILSLLLILCIVMVFLLSACGSDGPDYRTYTKVYKDSNGDWQSRDITYDAHVEGNPLLILVVIVVVLLLVAKVGKK